MCSASYTRIRWLPVNGVTAAADVAHGVVGKGAADPTKLTRHAYRASSKETAAPVER